MIFQRETNVIMNKYTDEQRLPRIGEFAINKNVEEAKIITVCLRKETKYFIQQKTTSPIKKKIISIHENNMTLITQDDIQCNKIVKLESRQLQPEQNKIRDRS